MFKKLVYYGFVSFEKIIVYIPVEFRILHFAEIFAVKRGANLASVPFQVYP